MEGEAREWDEQGSRELNFSNSSLNFRLKALTPAVGEGSIAGRSSAQEDDGEQFVGVWERLSRRANSAGEVESGLDGSVEVGKR